MKPTLLPFSSIIVPQRLRREYGDLTKLVASIQQYGLLQPLVIDQHNNLIAGGRRHSACALLGLQEIPVFYKEVLSEDQYREMELEENIQRLDMTWQEKTLGFAEVFYIKKRRSILAGERFTYKIAGEILGCSDAHIGYVICVAELLVTELDASGNPRPDAEYWKCDSMMSAYNLRMRKEQDAILAFNAQQQSNVSQPIQTNEHTTLPQTSEASPQSLSIPHQGAKFTDLEKEQARERYLANPHNPPGEFDLYWDEKVAESELPEPKPYLSLAWLKNIDCIQFMNHPDQHERFDHIITDPPYAIDMDNLDQANLGLSDVDTVKQQHQVDPNKELLVSLICSAYYCLKPNSFFILWADQMLWQFIYDQATNVGFKVQRWPITWVKLHRCMNGAAQYNFTKSTEIAIVCRKGTATLVEPAPTSVISAAHDEYKEQLGHPFVKPFDVWEYLIKHVSFEGQTILEPFAGRGSGVLSMLRMNRRVVACEIDTTHYNALVHFIKNHYLQINPNFQFT